MPNPYEWSTQMEAIIYEQVNRLVWDDPRTDMNDGISLGYPFEKIRNDVLKKGLTDFSKGFRDEKFGDLTPDDVVLLFCYVMMKRHFFACMATFESHATKINRHLGRKMPTVVVDFGCGPGTAGFAFADLFPGQIFDYIGVETAPPMRRKAIALWNSGRKSGLIGEGYRCEFVTTWSELPSEILMSESGLLLVFSLFFRKPFVEDGRYQIACTNRLANREGSQGMARCGGLLEFAV